MDQREATIKPLGMDEINGVWDILTMTRPQDSLERIPASAERASQIKGEVENLIQEGDFWDVIEKDGARERVAQLRPITDCIYEITSAADLALDETDYFDERRFIHQLAVGLIDHKAQVDVEMNTGIYGVKGEAYCQTLNNLLKPVLDMAEKAFDEEYGQGEWRKTLLQETQIRERRERAWGRPGEEIDQDTDRLNSI